MLRQRFSERDLLTARDRQLEVWCVVSYLQHLVARSGRSLHLRRPRRPGGAASPRR
jgi:hypothetical protein